MNWFKFHVLVLLAQLTACAATSKEVLPHSHDGRIASAMSATKRHHSTNYEKDLDSTVSQVDHFVVSTIFHNIAHRGKISSLRRQRKLALGDFQDLNEILKGAVIKIPNQSITVDAPLFPLNLDLSKLRCTGFSIGDMDLKYSPNNRLSVGLEIRKVDLQCSLTYRYSYAFLSGEGQADAYLDDNGARLSLEFESSSDVPTQATMKTCKQDKDMITINVAELDFRGGIVSSILEGFDDGISEAIEGSLRDIACSALGENGDSLASNLLQSANDVIGPYLEKLPLNYTDSLYVENELILPEAFDPLNLQDLDNELGDLITIILNGANAFLLGGAPTATRSGEEDLKVNNLIRENFLTDGALLINVNDLDFTPDGVIFEGHDQLTQTRITLDSLEVLGLDTIIEFDPLTATGKHTLDSSLKFSYLEAVVNITIDVQPSTKPDSLFERPGAGRIIEKVSVNFGVDDVAASLSTFLVIDQEKLESITFASLFDTKTLMNCLLSTVFDAQMSGLNVTVGNFREPVSSGFIGEGIDRVLSQGADFVFAVYERVLIQALPTVFQTTVRDIINTNIIRSFLDDSYQQVCQVRTKSPSSSPSSVPTIVPSFVPSKLASHIPSSIPTLSRYPSNAPSKTPSFEPSMAPLLSLSQFPSVEASSVPSRTPTSSYPSQQPSLPEPTLATTTNSPSSQSRASKSFLRKRPIRDFFD